MKARATYIFISVVCLVPPNLNAQDESVLFRGNVKRIEVREYAMMQDVKKFSNLSEYSIGENGKVNSHYEYVSGIEQPRPEFRDNPEEHANAEVFSSVIISSYNEKGQLTTDYRNERSTSKDRIVKYYKDGSGNDTLIESYTLGGKLNVVMQQKFNAENRLVSWQETDVLKEITLSIGTVTYEDFPNGSISKIFKDSVSWERAVPPFIRVYDQQGRLTEEYHLNTDKQKVYHVKSTYGATHPAMTTVYKDNGGSIVYQFDASGRMTTMAVMNKMNEQEFLRKSVYNEHGDIVTRTLTQSKGNMTVAWQFEYKYDLQGNWISVVEKENGNTYRFVERVLTYY